MEIFIVMVCAVSAENNSSTVRPCLAFGKREDAEQFHFQQSRDAIAAGVASVYWITKTTLQS